MIAIDPGKNGGIAWLDHDKILHTQKMPDTVGSIADLLRQIRTVAVHEVFLEKVGGFVAGTPAPGSAMFSFGENYGALQGCLACLGYRYQLVSPQTWQKPLGMGTRASSGGATEWKRKLKAEAQRRFPTIDVTLWNADALLILDYGINLRSP